MSKSPSSKLEKRVEQARQPAAQPTSLRTVAPVSYSGPKLQVDAEVARCIRQHARSHMKTEVCGVLIGDNTKGIVEVQASIEALNAAQAGTHVTFTQDAWESIYKVKDEMYPNERIVGWYHSHPGFGVFLSEHDTFIHRNFFSSPDQVAWVYDPHTDEEGCFGWINGDIHRISAFNVVDLSGDGVERTPKHYESQADVEEDLLIHGHDEAGKRGSAGGPPAWLRWTVTVSSYIAAIALGFIVAYLFFPRLVGIPIDPFTGQPLLLHEQGRPAPSPSASPQGSPTSPAQAGQPARPGLAPQAAQPSQGRKP